MKIIGFAGYSGSGKTTLIERLIPVLAEQGLRVSVIKHTHHDFDMDTPGKDSHRHRAAGAGEVLLMSDRRWALLHESRQVERPDVMAMAGRLSPCDVVLVEGCKGEAIPKIEVHRSSTGHPLLFPHDSHIVALAGDAPTHLPRFPLDAIEAIARFIQEFET